MKSTRREILGLAAGFTAAQALPALAQGELHVGAYPANPPWEFQTTSGAFRGFEVDIVRAVSKRIGMNPDFKGMSFSALFVACASHRVDMVISSLTITNKRLEHQSFTQPFVAGALGVGVKDNSHISSMADLKDKVVGSIATSFPENWLKKHHSQIGYREYKSYNTLSNLLTDLGNGRIDAAVNDVVGLRYAFTRMQGMKIAAEVATNEQYAIMMPKGSKLLKPVNKAISDMKTDGTMAALYKKWLGVDPEEGSYTVTPMPIPTSV